MLAYLFWHWPADRGLAAEYEAMLARFVEELTATGSEGFHGAASYRVEGAPWVSGGSGYEDWYLLDGSFALDPLNEIAVSPALRPAHDGPAHAAGGGAGGLYRLIDDRHSPAAATAATWFSKPGGMRYPEFYAEVVRFSEVAGFSFWRRQMVLGPAPEFCLLGNSWADVPPEWSPARVARTPIQ